MPYYHFLFEGKCKLKDFLVVNKQFSVFSVRMKQVLESGHYLESLVATLNDLWRNGVKVNGQDLSIVKHIPPAIEKHPKSKQKPLPQERLLL